MQEQIHHADYEDNRLEQRLNHILHRDFDEFGAVFRIGDIVTLRHLTLELGNLIFHQRRGIQGVSARRHHHRDPGSRMAVEIGGGGVIFAAHLNAGDVAQAHHRTVALALDDNLFELGDGLQPRLGTHGGGQLLRVGGG